MGAKTIYLARHGSHDELGHVLSARSEIAPNAAGREEADRLAAAMQQLALRSIHSSPRRRARDMAARVAEEGGREVIVTEALDEVDFGKWSGKRFADLDADPRWRAWNAHRWQAATPAGETMGAVVDRAGRYIAAIEEGPALCVSHCDVIRALVARYRDLPEDAFFSVAIDPGSVTRIDFEDGVPHVVAVNERPQ